MIRNATVIGDGAMGTVCASQLAINGVEVRLWSRSAELAETINSVTNNPSPIKYLPGREWDNSIKRMGSTEKSEKKLGFLSEVQIDEGLKKTVQWTKENMEFIDGTIAKHNKYL